ncbi:MAG: N-6 DNA methylase [Chthoniobacter sp.]|nr:N-6 DNA methylase [Chthoniobacter sp.]
MSAQHPPSFLDKESRKFGFPPLVALDGEPGPKQLSYLDLLRARKTAKSKKSLLPEAVAEFQGRPLLYLVDGNKNTAPLPKLRELQQLLANRGEHACIALVQPGQMTVYPVNLDANQLVNVAPEIIKVTDPRAPLFFQSLAAGTQQVAGMPTESDYVFEKIHTLLKGASSELTGPLSRPLKPLEVLSTTGRALFFRFLHDRGIVRTSDLSAICPHALSGDLLDVFSDPKKAAATSAWLDETFNGDLLPLVDGVTPLTSRAQRRKEYLTFYETAGKATGDRLFAHLQAILRGWDSAGASNFQYTINWSELNFAHIPVGVLSQVYETFSHQWDAPHATETSVHYTPRKIAQLVVTESLAGVEKPAKAHVLDAACGAGVFLVIALREIVRHRWLADNRRPGKDAIHKILYEQLCGFDVSEHALRLAALGLYITAIELNSIHRPPSLHHAPAPLQGSVLHNFDDPSEHRGGRRRFVEGSLGAKPGTDFDARFDVVFGNPPWTPLSPQGETDEEKKADAKRIKALNDRFTAVGRTVLAKRGLDNTAKTYRNPNNVPDMPFLWRATQWAKPGGILGFTLDARLVLMQGGTYRAAREALFNACKVTGILNGSCLEKTAVWPGMDKPFIVFFAKNEVSPDGHAFHFATPVRESVLSKRGEFRLDYASVQTVQVADIERSPWLLKTLTVGNTLDVEVVEKLHRCFNGRTVGKTWTEPLFTGRGFSLKPRPTDRKAPIWLQKLPLFQIPEDGTLPAFRTRNTFKQIYGESAPYQTCGEEIYKAPLLLIPQTPGEDRTTFKSFRSKDESLCYEQSIYGYSGGKHPDATIHLALLHLITHSELFRYWCLVRSSRIGASWRTFIKEDIDAFPFPDVSELRDAPRRKIEQLADTLDAGIPSDWKSLDSFIYKLYDLTNSEAEVVSDTVTYRSPYRTARIPAEQPPRNAELDEFCARLQQLLQPLFTLTQQTLEIGALPQISDESGAWLPPWRFVAITLAGQSVAATPVVLARLMRAAATTSASRIIMRIAGGGLILGLLNQRRFWTFSRARLCAVEIAREHSDWFPLPSTNSSRAKQSSR